MRKEGILAIILLVLIITLIAFVTYQITPKKVFLSPCEPNWILQDTSCRTDDTIEYYYINNATCEIPETIIDNSDPDFYTIGYWESSTTIPGYEGLDYLSSYNDSGENKSIWNFTDISPAIYKVYVKYTSHEVRASNAPYTINYVDGTELITINQSENGGLWILLGEYNLDSESYLELTNNADNVVVADAVNLTYVSPISSNPPSANTTEDCDYNGNNIIGNISDFNQTNIALTIYINGTKSNLTENFNSERTIEFRESSLTRIKFDYDFETALNIRNIQIIKQPASSEIGYLIIKGIEAEKTLTIDKINSESWKVCVKDSEVNNIDELTEKCTSSNEYPVSCPGNLSGFTCDIVDDKFIVTGLDHSAVKELINISSSISEPVNCTSNWLCSNWTSCITNQQTRTCIDTNNCSTPSIPQPSLTQACISCTPDWDCDDWSACVSGVQTKTCIDSNNCNKTTGKPATSQTCTEEEIDWVFWIVISILIIAIIAVSIAIIYLWNKKQQTSFNNSKSPFKIQFK